MQMKGDFSRRTFDKSKHYSSVQMQQGRVQIDADWNEQADIFHHHLRTKTQDFIGGDGVPVGNQGYAIRVVGTTNDNLSISAGRYYVNGLLFENENNALFTEQTDYPGASFPAVDGLYLAYGDMWQRHITTLEDADLQEAALNGIDTTTRIKNIAQVKLLRVGDVSMLADSNTVFPEWDARITPSNGQLAARVNSTPTLGNQLYRVEVHQAGDENSATFKWSRDNGIVTAKIEAIENDMITVSQAQQAENLNFSAGQWIELSNEKMQLHNEPGYFVRLGRVQDNQFVVSIWPDSISSLDITEKAALLNTLTQARRWDTPESTLIAGDAYTAASSVVRDANNNIVITLASGQSMPENIAVGKFVELTNQSLVDQGSEAYFTQIKIIDTDRLTVRDLVGVNQNTLASLNRFRVVGSGTATVNDTGFILLENGLEIKFGAGNYQSGDYWLIPARSAINNIDWPLDKNTGQAAMQRPHGEQHHYVRLALVEYQNNSWTFRADCRRIFSPITDFKQIDALQAEPNAPLGSLYVDNVGNVGVGNNNPQVVLDVTGDVNIDGAFSHVPAGTVFTMATETVPPGFYECNGQYIKRSVALALYTVIGDMYGAPSMADGENTFKLPDYRGQFLRGWDNAAGVDPDMATRIEPTDGTIVAGDHVGTEQRDEFKSHTHPYSYWNGTGAYWKPGAFKSGYAGVTTEDGTNNAIGFKGGSETRPKNISVMYIIKG